MRIGIVKEIYGPITEHRGYFAAGKFDELGRNVPYNAIVKAFRDLMCQLLTESEARLSVWRHNFLDALGESAQVLVDVVPELELIIGSQPAAPEIGPNESVNRFNYLVSHFVRVCCASDHPLVIFLDDFQWADVGSFKLLQLIMTDEEIRNILVVGAFRDSECNYFASLLRPPVAVHLCRSRYWPRWKARRGELSLIFFGISRSPPSLC